MFVTNNNSFISSENRKWFGNGILIETFIMFGLLSVMLGFFFYSLITKNIILVLDFDIGFSDSSSTFADNLIHLYNTIWVILLFVVFFILVILFRILYLFSWQNSILNNNFFNLIINFWLDYFVIINVFLLDEKNLVNLFNRINIYETKIINLNLWYDLDKKLFLTISDISEYKKLEILWCLLPILSLLFIATPTFSLIFSLDSFVDPVYTVKIMGRQWYWNYSFDVNIHKNRLNCYEINRIKPIVVGNLKHYLPSYKHVHKLAKSIFFVSIQDIEKYSLTYKNKFISLDFDSVMISDDDLVKGMHRLLEVDNRLILPIGIPIRLLITSADVLHSWAVPALGVKVDAVPGRLNQFIIEIKRPGVFYGQCSELCGPLHGFMPIVIQAVSLEKFEGWLLNNK